MSSVECSEYEKLKEELIGLGLYEDGMNVDDMMDLMAAIRNSEDSAIKEERLRESSKKENASRSSETVVKEVKRGMERRYKNVPDRRLPWNLFPFPEQLSLEQKSRILAAYKEQLALCQYRKARSSSVFSEWNCVYKLPLKLSTEYKSKSFHTRSGRTLKSTPHYIDEDSDSESASVSKKPRKKMRKLTNEEIISKSSLFRDTVNVDNNVENEKPSDKYAHKPDSGEPYESGALKVGGGEGSESDKSVIELPALSYSNSPEFDNDVAVYNEDYKVTSRKRARLLKDTNIE